MCQHHDPNPEHMRRAVQLSAERMRANLGGPFGAVIVRDGKVIAEGFNQVTTSNDPTAHAEVMAIRNACEALGHIRLKAARSIRAANPAPCALHRSIGPGLMLCILPIRGRMLRQSVLMTSFCIWKYPNHCLNEKYRQK